MKVEELQGALLDYWVGRAMGIGGICLGRHEATYVDKSTGINIRAAYSPSTSWAHGGPIIESEGIATYRYDDWVALVRPDVSPGGDLMADIMAGGPTLLIAAMRAYVTSKFGSETEEVPVRDHAPVGMMT